MELKTVAGKLGISWTTEEGHAAVLKFGSSRKNPPHRYLPVGSTLQMTNSGQPADHTTLTVAYKDMEDSTPTVTWSASNDCVTLTAPANASAADNIRIAQANEPGTVTITATVNA